jgi:hypothetical protein
MHWAANRWEVVGADRYAARWPDHVAVIDIANGCRRITNFQPSYKDLRLQISDL